MMATNVAGNAGITINANVAVKTTRIAYCRIGLIITWHRHTSICLVVKHTMAMCSVTRCAKTTIYTGVTVVTACSTRQIINITILSWRTDIVTLRVLKKWSWIVAVICECKEIGKAKAGILICSWDSKAVRTIYLYATFKKGIFLYTDRSNSYQNWRWVKVWGIGDCKTRSWSSQKGIWSVFGWL